jgi:threonine aldolase
MGNNIAIKMHTQHGQEVICDARAHIFDWELSMVAWFSGCLARTIATQDGILRWEEVRKYVKAGSPHRSATGLIAIENSHNMAGGVVYPIEVIEELCDQAHARRIPIHMDGARVFNAACYLKRPVHEIADSVDSVMFCLSKGLGAPVGSMVVGTEEAIAQGRLYRKRLGGGMRQAGILAAAGLIALEEMTKRLDEDHANARFIAQELAGLPGIKIDPARVQTNIVIFDVTETGMTSAEFSKQCREHGLSVSTANPACVRMVTHHNVSRADCEQAMQLVRQVVARVPAPA